MKARRVVGGRQSAVGGRWTAADSGRSAVSSRHITVERKQTKTDRRRPKPETRTPTIIPGRQTANPTIIHKHAGFICPKCGYPAHKLSKHTHCPLCVICSRCGFSVRNCTCIEGE